ncbi:AAA family ATPase [Xenorhabdus lircayensis]|uniref:ATP-binding protein n=1 Tax=Xenorhabdus lircayensis TaxID=2763499 RepID=A0ABS0U8S7_9GAMM|nr:ATP-binding protein [Xenorhabdus lircayensis]MBI6549383.1 ATP-binding protein [Xenorhabdus lircayensis]
MDSSESTIERSTAEKETSVLHILCGKIASGKSTLSAKLALQPMTIVISEDQWLSRLYASEIKTVSDYVHCASKLRNAVEPHLIALLKAGISVVLDFPANTISNRKWMKGIIDATKADNRLHFLEVPDEVCLARLRLRNQSGTHDFSTTEEQFELITRYFVTPQEEEGFNIVLHNL